MKWYGAARISTMWDTLRTSYWFVPSVMAALTVGLWFSVNAVDTGRKEESVTGLQWVYSGGPEGARELLGVVAGSMITVTGVTFSITIVALALASQQFGPFLLRNFLRDTGDQVVLGTFISNFIFCLLTLRLVRGPGSSSYVPHLCVSVSMLLTLCSIGVLIYFIHHVAVSIQAPYIINVVNTDLEQAIDRMYPDSAAACSYEGEEGGAPGLNPGTIPRGVAEVRAAEYGYIKAIDHDLVIKTAARHDVVVWLQKRPGEFVGEGDVIATVSGSETAPEEIRTVVNKAFVLGVQRTATQDILFLCEEIAEIAVRALSPGINDPFTAIICIDHLGQGLRRMAERAQPPFCRLDRKGRARLVAYPVGFPEVVDAAFSQIRHYGSSNPAVLRRLLSALAMVAPHAASEEDRQALLHHALQIREAGEKNLSGAENEAVAEGYGEVVKVLRRGTNTASSS